MNTDLIAHKNPQKVQVIARFVGQVARATRHQQSLDQGERQNLIAEYAELLARRDLPRDAFTMEALDSVLQGMEWFPTVNALAASLLEFCRVRDYRQRQAGEPQKIEGVSGRDLSAIERSWLRYWQNGESVRWAINPGETTVAEDVEANRRKVALSMLKRYAPFVWRGLTGNHGETDGGTWNDPHRIARTDRLTKGSPARKPLMGMLRSGLTKHAPHLLPQLDELETAQ